MTLIYFLLISVCCMLSVHSIGYYPCSRQDIKQYIGVIGELKGVDIHFSCKHPSKFIVNGEAVQVVNKAGPFLVLRRSGNEFRCVKEMVVDPKGLTVIIYSLPWIKHENNPEICEVCASSANWTLEMFVARNIGYNNYKKALGCNVPVDCPINNLYTDIPCTSCEPQEDDGLCCRACQRNKKYY